MSRLIGLPINAINANAIYAKDALVLNSKCYCCVPQFDVV